MVKLHSIHGFEKKDKAFFNEVVEQSPVRPERSCGLRQSSLWGFVNGEEDWNMVRQNINNISDRDRKRDIPVKAESITSGL